MIEELHPDEVEAILHRHHVGRLACVAANRPYVVPITYVYAGDAVYGRTLLGRKVAALRAEPHACFEVDEREEPGVWRSVVAEGIYEELTDAAERASALGLLARTSPAVRLPADGTGGVVFRLRLTAKEGRQAVAEPPAVGQSNAAWAAGAADADHPLLRVDLWAGDDQNWPSHS